MAFLEGIIGAIIFVLTAGFLGRERFEKNPVLMSLVVVLSVGSTIGTVYFLKNWVLSLVDERYDERQAFDGMSGPAQPLGPQPDPRAIELEYWRSISGSRNPEVFREYLRRYPDGEFAHIARERIRDLKAPPPSAPQTERTAIEPPAETIPERVDKAVPRTLFDALVIEDFSYPDQSSEPFPRDHLMRKLRSHLAAVPTRLKRLEFAVAFVEPREFRGRTYGGSVHGFIAASLPSVSGCVTQFGLAKFYNTTTVQAGMAMAIDEQVTNIAEWLKDAASGDALRCPG